MNSDDLPYPYHHDADAAMGWLMLSDWKSAEAELKKIPDKFAANHTLLKTQIRIHLVSRQGHRALALAEKLVQTNPNDPAVWNLCALALQNLNRIKEAYTLLLPVLKKFPDFQAVSYNLGCFLCQLGRLAEAIPFLRWTFLLNDSTARRERALADSDLRLLWLWRGIRTASQLPSLWIPQLCAKNETVNTEASGTKQNNLN